MPRIVPTSSVKRHGASDNAIQAPTHSATGHHSGASTAAASAGRARASRSNRVATGNAIRPSSPPAELVDQSYQDETRPGRHACSVSIARENPAIDANAAASTQARARGRAAHAAAIRPSGTYATRFASPSLRDRWLPCCTSGTTHAPGAAPASDW